MKTEKKSNKKIKGSIFCGLLRILAERYLVTPSRVRGKKPGKPVTDRLKKSDRQKRLIIFT
jgi:hypothetical protein